MTQERAELRRLAERTFSSPSVTLAMLDHIDVLENALRRVREWETDDHVRYCVFCRVSGYASSPAATHAPDCPRLTMPEVWEEKA